MSSGVSSSSSSHPTAVNPSPQALRAMQKNMAKRALIGINAFFIIGLAGPIFAHYSNPATSQISLLEVGSEAIVRAVRICSLAIEAPPPFLVKLANTLDAAKCFFLTKNTIYGTSTYPTSIALQSGMGHLINIYGSNRIDNFGLAHHR